jgi:hypothetical protein
LRRLSLSIGPASGRLASIAFIPASLQFGSILSLRPAQRDFAPPVFTAEEFGQSVLYFENDSV